jgi:hypothetical protein
MDERRTDPPPRPPVARAEDPAPVVPPGPPFPPPDAGPPSGVDRSHPPSRLARLARSPRGAAGLAIVVAALLLWPFSGWAAIPWLAGLAVLVLLRLLRLDGLLRGWAPHLAGIAVVAGLLLSTSPWAWALAASSGVLLAGLVQLPAWRLAALGGALCVVSGAAFAWDQVRDRASRVEAQRQTSEQNFALFGERSPNRVLPALLEGIAQEDVTGVCGLLDEPARRQFTAAARTATCPEAVSVFHAAAGPGIPYEQLDVVAVPAGEAWQTDGCATVWARAPLGGPTLGQLFIRRSGPPGDTFFIAEFRPC